MFLQEKLKNSNPIVESGKGKINDLIIQQGTDGLLKFYNMKRTL